MSLIPVFDLAERDLRWGRVRQAMDKAGIDCLIGFPNSAHWDQFQAGIRYLTQIGGNTTEAAVVFPLAGEVTAYVRGENEVLWWGSKRANRSRPCRPCSKPPATSSTSCGQSCGRA